jgi:multiple sugar transport system substrate-binding protein
LNIPLEARPSFLEGLTVCSSWSKNLFYTILLFLPFVRTKPVSRSVSFENYKPSASGGKALPVIVTLCAALAMQGCGQETKVEEKQDVTIVFKHGKIFGDPEPVKKLIEKFEKQNPGFEVKDETLPASTDEQHQFYVINLEGASSAFDVLAMDVIWVQEFARAGWLKDLSSILPPERREEFFKGPMEAATYRDGNYAIPWYIDAGVLYYRKDLLNKYGFAPPKTWSELVHIASTIIQTEQGMYGFMWQGKQYEGLVCNVLEYLWSGGGDVLKGDHVVLDSPENRKALSFMKDLIYRYRITPEFITTTTEESSRRIFGSGKALFMRNWPYAWSLFEREGSAVKGKVGVTTLPAFAGHRSAPTLGGWHLGVNQYSRHPREAARFIQFITSYEAQKGLALATGYQPTRRRLYHDKDLLRTQPFTASLAEIFDHARPRPVSPYYMMLSQVMQPTFSAVLSRILKPEEALRSAQEQIEFILRKEK